jgi:hypothetical protein
MRTPFYDDSRLIVVLYREGWGETEWTRVESTAIQESLLKFGWERLFFIALDKPSRFPTWLPSQTVRFNLEDYGLEQAVGAIKSRVEEFGGQLQPMTPTKRAAILKDDELYRARVASISHSDVIENARKLFDLIVERCAPLIAEHGLDIQSAVSFEYNREKCCLLRGGQVALSVTWCQPYSNALTDAELVVKELNGRVLLPEEQGRYMLTVQPEPKKTIRYLPHLSRTGEHGWKLPRTETFSSNQELADECLLKLLDLMDASSKGNLKPPRLLRRVDVGASGWMS